MPVIWSHSCDCNRYSGCVFIDNFSIKYVDNIKFLGVILDSKLSWRQHISQVCLTISRNIGVMSKLRYKLPDSAMLLLYNALILPHLMYCNIVWGGAGKSLFERLFKLQKRSIRIITYSMYIAYTSPLFSKLKVLNLKDIFSLQVLLFVYKCKFPLCDRSI
jgi:hypothetical protein